jgi:hypothetical protein
MPFFKSTYNILKRVDHDEVFNPNWMDSDKLVLPPKIDWDYSREMFIEDVDIWEVLYEATDGIGIYVSWSPYAEFYMITIGIDYKNEPFFIDKQIYWNKNIETYYAQGAQEKVFKRAKELGINLSVYKTWVEDENLWLYQSYQPIKQIILPNFKNNL